jgi:NAD-dependent deacetylase
MDDKIISALKKTLKNGKKVSFLVGAGISAESGIPTFRGKDGYWVSGSKNYKAEEIGTFRMFSHSSKEVWKWYLYRKSITEFALPNQSHHMLKEIEDVLGDQFALISQNVDGLHKKAGSSEARTFLIHGDFDFVRCGAECTEELYPFPAGIPLKGRDKDVITDEEWALLRCPKCGDDLRPHVLWFDEVYNERYYKLYSVLSAVHVTGLLFVLGTSGATGLPTRIVHGALEHGTTVVEVNLEESTLSNALFLNPNGVVVRQGSSAFLSELRRELEGMGD